MRAVPGLVVVGALLLGACTSGDGERSGADGTSAPAGSSAESTGSEWPAYGHDESNTRANTSSAAIDGTTAADLTLDWEREGLVGVTGTPTVAEGVAYFGDWTGTIHAVDADSGAERWTAPIGGFVVGSPVVEGSAVYASSGRRLVRFDRESGEEQWAIDVHDHPQAQINASPVVVDDLVIQGVAGFENIVSKEQYTFRGAIAGYDTRTGAERWHLFTTSADASSGAGAGVWSTPAIDRGRGLLYVGTGQSLAEPTAPLTDSLLAIDYSSGELVWSQQFTYPDVFSAAHPTGKDADVGASPNLWSSDGRDLVGAGDKGGTYHALDRATGEVVWETQLTPGSVFGGQIGSAAFVDGRLIATSNVGDPDTNAPTDRTRAFGLDPATGRVLWRTEELPGKIFAPVSAVRGVAFVATDRGRLMALDTTTGDELWGYDAPAAVGGGPSIVDGRVIWGYGFTLFSGPGEGGILSFTAGG